MRDDFIFGATVFVTAFIAGIAVGLFAAPDGINQAGQVACQSINKTWALIDGQYMCVTVTE